VVYRLVRIETPAIKNAIIRLYTTLFKLNMNEAVEPDPFAYPTMNALFTRALRPEARPLPDDESQLVSPADGVISEFGAIDNTLLIQAKGQYYSHDLLLGGNPDLSRPFNDGLFATVYLSPRDYHRVHMPFTGRLTDMIHVPGRLHSVSLMTTRHIPELFSRNERVVCLFDTDAGRMAVVLVGAINVAAIETVWAGLITPPAGKEIRHTHYDQPIELQRGDELGRFNMGSTVIVLMEKDRFEWLDGLESYSAVKMGQGLAAISTIRE
jgi:phosphatidylserine decarboxylase